MVEFRFRRHSQEAIRGRGRSTFLEAVKVLLLGIVDPAGYVYAPLSYMLSYMVLSYMLLSYMLLSQTLPKLEPAAKRNAPAASLTPSYQ